MRTHEEYALYQALMSTRQEPSTISIQKVAELINMAFKPEEIAALIKQLNDYV